MTDRVADAAPALALSGIRKAFGAVQALDDASLTVAGGRIVALLGENGAGKTTLMRVAFGLVAPDAGEVRVAGRVVRVSSPAAAARLGIGMVHQHFTLVPAMSVAENVALGIGGRYDRAATVGRIRRVVEETGLALDPVARAGDLAAGGQQRLEIVKAIAAGARILILDEPTAVLTPAEARELMRFLRTFAAGGGSVVLITHKLHEALDVADAVTVMRHGRTVAALPAALADVESVARAMLGDRPTPDEREELSEGDRGPRPGPRQGAAVASLRDVTIRDGRGVALVRAASLAIHGGEIVGVAGAEGSGHREILLALAGRLAPSSGEVKLPERVGFVPEDRHRDAVMLEWTLTENVALTGAAKRRGVINWKQIESTTEALIRQYDISAAGARASMGELSGGNQQRLVLARELDGGVEMLVAEQPTRGLDIAATAAVHRRIRAVRDAGGAVVLASADVDELVQLGDRVVVMYAGQLREVAVSADEIGRAMLGVA